MIENVGNYINGIRTTLLFALFCFCIPALAQEPVYDPQAFRCAVFTCGKWSAQQRGQGAPPAPSYRGKVPAPGKSKTVPAPPTSGGPR